MWTKSSLLECGQDTPSLACMATLNLPFVSIMCWGIKANALLLHARPASYC